MLLDWVAAQLCFRKQQGCPSLQAAVWTSVWASKTKPMQLPWPQHWLAQSAAVAAKIGDPKSPPCMSRPVPTSSEEQNVLEPGSVQFTYKLTMSTAPACALLVINGSRSEPAMALASRKTVRARASTGRASH